MKYQTISFLLTLTVGVGGGSTSTSGKGGSTGGGSMGDGKWFIGPPTSSSDDDETTTISGGTRAETISGGTRAGSTSGGTGAGTLTPGRPVTPKARSPDTLRSPPPLQEYKVDEKYIARYLGDLTHEEENGLMKLGKRFQVYNSS